MDADDLVRYAAVLRENRIFAALGALDAELLLQAGELRRLEPSEALFHEGDPCDGLYVLMEGSFYVVGGESGQQVAVAELKRGQCIGEMALVSGAARTRTVGAAGEAVAWHLSERGFELLLAQADPLAAAILDGIARELCQRFRMAVSDATSLVPDLMHSDAGRALVARMEWDA
jgi:CRP-like cAMP-binding protein